MRHQRYHLPLLAVGLFCLTSMGGCPNNVPAGQFTVVQGKVINRLTTKPLPGVRVVLTSDPTSLRNYYLVKDSARTDAQGKYTFSFTNVKGEYYAVSCEGAREEGSPYHLEFPDSVSTAGPNSGTSTGYDFRTLDVIIGRTNALNFRPYPRRVWQVQVTTLTTSYQKLYFSLAPYSYYPSPYFPADNQRRSVLLYQPVQLSTFVPRGLFPQSFYQSPGFPPVAHFSRVLPSGTSQDTTVQLTPTTALTGDTVRATLKFGR